MDGAAVQVCDYAMPTGKLGLKGPVPKPAPGTLPLRGDLAHIALAETHLAAHYVIPHRAKVGEGGAQMLDTARSDAEVSVELEAGAVVEVLDLGSHHIWCCLGPQGPSGYILTERLEGLAEF